MKAMVLCAGYGTRLGHLTREIPKPMLPIAGRPMLAYILHHLRVHGVREIAINLHFKPGMIREYFGDGSQFGVAISYSIENELLGTAGGLKNVENFFEGETDFLVQYGDIITDQDFTAMIESHRKRNALATLLVHHRPGSNSVLTLDNESRITGFLERPTSEDRKGVASDWANSGICIANRELLSFIPSGVPADLPRDVYTKLISTGRIFGFPLTGYRCAVDSPERLAAAESAIANGHCQLRP